MKISITTKLHTKRLNGERVPFEETARVAKAAGFRELDMSLDDLPFLLSPDWQRNMEARMETAAQMGVKIRYTHTPYSYPKEGDSEGWARFDVAMKRAIAAAAMAGADYSAIHPRTNMTDAYDSAVERERALRFLAPICEEAQRAGVRLALENMRGPGESKRGIRTRYAMETDDVIDLADELGIGVCWDTGHGKISGQPQYDSIMKLGNRLKMVHINDNFAEDDIHLPPLLGRIDWHEVMRALADVGYQGNFNLEVSANKLPDAARPGYAESLYRIAEEIVSYQK